MYFPEAAESLRARILNLKLDSLIAGASIDTRTLSAGNLFVALRGTKDDGHRFLDGAFKKGASGALIDEAFVRSRGGSIPDEWNNLILVPDTAEAFLKLAGYYRNQFTLKAAVAVIGSVGKTSTKEFLAYLLRTQFQTLCSEGNLNNHLGLPLTLFRLRDPHDVCVCELGTNQLGDIRKLSQVFRPDAGLLTRIAPEHLEGFGSMEKVYEGELELFECLPEDSCVVIPDNDPVLLEKISRFSHRWIKVGESNQADYRVSGIRCVEGQVYFKVKGREFHFPSSASFLALNAAMAVAMSEVCGLSLSKIPQSWEDIKLPSGRFQVQALASGAKVVFDGYNASPASFEAALKSFEEIQTDGRKMLIFSDMLELGHEEKKFHEDLGRRIAACSLDYVAAYGARSRWGIDSLREINPHLNAEWVPDAREAAGRLGGLKKGDYVLLKASRGMKIEEVLSYLSGSEQSVHHSLRV